MKYLLHYKGLGAIVTMLDSDDSEYYGKVQNAFCGNDPDAYVDMIPLWPNHVTPNGVPYDWGLAGPQGAWYTLIQYPDITTKELVEAKRYIRRSFDCVNLRVLRIKRMVLLHMPQRRARIVYVVKPLDAFEAVPTGPFNTKEEAVAYLKPHADPLLIRDHYRGDVDRWYEAMIYTVKSA